MKKDDIYLLNGYLIEFIGAGFDKKMTDAKTPERKELVQKQLDTLSELLCKLVKEAEKRAI